ncbi:MAG TPA: HlyD family efflux transporter periplasmic adaptor subunit [Anaerolineales bacterium]|nr:HlyD family efflux transporter periplasmic adaptor subunit [Anaerolineales bacterium]
MKSINMERTRVKGFEWKPFFQKNKFWLAGVLLVLLAAGGYGIYRTNNAAQAAAETATTAELQTAVASTGSLTVLATGAGEVVTASEISLGFDESGTLLELLVKAGDSVDAGQGLARLQTDRTAEYIALALAQAELNALTAQQELDNLNASWEMDAAEALLAVEDAEQALEDLRNSNISQAEAAKAVTEAQTAVNQAQSIYSGARTTADADTIAAAKAELVLAQKQLNDIQEKFDDYVKKPDTDPEKANMQLKLSAAQGAYNTALRYYNAVTGTGSALDLESTAADLAAAQATLAQAQRTYERIKDGPSEGELAKANAELAVARAKYETLKTGVDPLELSLTEATLANARASLAVAQEDRAVLELTAPQPGTILTVSAGVGEAVSTAAIITLADLNQPLLEVYLDEDDLEMAVVGYEAEVVFDSLPDNVFTGHVVEVSPVLYASMSADTILMKVELDVDSYAKPQSLPVGSNATVDVIGGRAENAVLVPVEALREIDDGEYAVFVMENGEPRLRPVTVGLMDYTSAEITSGLEAGVTVTTGTVPTLQTSN